MANILGLIHLLIEEISDENQEIKLHLNFLEKSANRLDEVIHDLNKVLDLRDQKDDKKEVIHLEELTKKIRLNLYYQIRDCGALIHTDFSEVDEIFSVKSYFESILFNLISNAIKYRSNERQLEIFIKTFLKDDKIEMIVRDNGLGIDLKYVKEKVFMLYQRFHANIKGKGLGLYLVKTQIETLGGTIDINSEIDNGTSFVISLPKFPE